jgi:hypothetical protein
MSAFAIRPKRAVPPSHNRQESEPSTVYRPIVMRALDECEASRSKAYRAVNATS